MYIEDSNASPTNYVNNNSSAQLDKNVISHKNRRQFEVSKTTGSLRSITQSIARRNSHKNTSFEQKQSPANSNYLAKETLIPKMAINTQSKLEQTIRKLDKKALKRIKLLQQGQSDNQNAYPCIFLKKKNLPKSRSILLLRNESEDQNQQQISISGETTNTNKSGVWQQLSQAKLSSSQR